MSSTVSKSAKIDDHELTRAEKDDSFSTGAGRMAVEVSKPDRHRACVENAQGSKQQSCAQNADSDADIE
ncbi:MAG TPA: hypothetical protein V6C97_36575 [Oculatellaceae cyanobacterium]